MRNQNVLIFYRYKIINLLVVSTPFNKSEVHKFKYMDSEFCWYIIIFNQKLNASSGTYINTFIIRFKNES